MIPPWIGPAIGLISLSFGITFFLLARRARLKGPTWAARSNNLVRGFKSSLPGLEILFRNQRIDTLTVSRIAFWNRGQATIDGNDIAPADPVRIVPLGGTRLLDVKIVQASGESSRFEAVLDEDGKAAYLRFDFLDRDQGAVVQVVHTGDSGTDLSVIGTLKGAGTPVMRNVRGAYLPLPTSVEFDRKIKPLMRRRLALGCEVAALAALVGLVIILLFSGLYPSQWAHIRAIWATFEKDHPFRAGLLEGTAIMISYPLTFVLMKGTFLRPMLPAGLMALVDDPLE